MKHYALSSALWWGSTVLNLDQSVRQLSKASPPWPVVRHNAEEKNMTIRKPSPIGLSLLAALRALVLGGPQARAAGTDLRLVTQRFAHRIRCSANPRFLKLSFTHKRNVL
jgi:hypothetical protein